MTLGHTRKRYPAAVSHTPKPESLPAGTPFPKDAGSSAPVPLSYLLVFEVAVRHGEGIVNGYPVQKMLEMKCTLSKRYLTLTQKSHLSQISCCRFY